MSDKMREELDDIAVLTALRKAGATEKELAILTYESGPYEITKPTVFMQKLASVLAAQSVPVVEEPVAYACPFHAGEAVVNGTPCMLVGERNVNDYAKERGFPLVVQPTHSITTAELERLRKDAERYAVVRDSTYCDVYMHEIYLTDDDLDAAIDAVTTFHDNYRGAE